MTVTDLAALTAEIEAYVAENGWDQPPRLFALVPTRELLESEPQLADALGDADPDGLTPVEQDGVDPDVANLLSTIAWPAAVAGCALVNEVVMLPQDVESELPADANAAEWAAAHPQRRDVRVALAVLRDGTETATLRVRSADGGEDDVVTSAGLVPHLAEALVETLVVDTDEAAG